MEIMGLENPLEIYKGKKILVTGHTGFKGSWLSIWLHKLGAHVIGFSLDPIHEKDNFVLSDISSKIKDIRGDVRDLKALLAVFQSEQPDIVFHLAAQSLVKDGYTDPIYTYETNVMGTANVLECMRLSKGVQTGIFITTDKVYENKEWIWPYRETEPMGGYDPYSSSKGATELIIASYRNSFFNPKHHKSHLKSIASVRAGNVIGGGDWASNRIVPDCIRALENKKAIEVRNPNSVRPWQLVLEPLYGYLLLGKSMMKSPTKFAEAWNFGPKIEDSVEVRTLVEKIIELFESGKWKDMSDPTAYHEAKLLTLDINKAKYFLQWQPVLNFEETMKFTVDWYKNYRKMNVLELCSKQIDAYMQLLKTT